MTDLCLMSPDPDTSELTVTSLHEGVSREQVQAATGWEVRFAEAVASTARPPDHELKVLRELHARTARAHAGA